MHTGHLSGSLAATLTAALLLCCPASAFRSDDRIGIAAQFLAPHNAARSALRLSPLPWDPRLARYAEGYGRILIKDCQLVHSRGPYGENLFWGSGGGGGWSPAQAVAGWASERRWYRHGSNSCARGVDCGHYTQMVWRRTKNVGCAVVSCDRRRGVIIVCEYDPPGNYVGERPY